MACSHVGGLRRPLLLEHALRKTLTGTAGKGPHVGKILLTVWYVRRARGGEVSLPTRYLFNATLGYTKLRAGFHK
jgi:hypothetical protein